MNKATQQQVAIKIIRKKKIAENSAYMELMRNELFVLEKTDHPHVVRVFEILETKGKFFVVMEFLNEGDLMGKVMKMHNFSEDHAAMIVDQILHALCYIHSQNVTHRDLKPDNIMCIGDGDNMQIKLTDFGFACFFNPNKKMDISLGTPYYMAPELVDGREYNQKVDIWSLGCISYMLLSGKLPFDGKNLEEIADAILEKDITFPKEQWGKVSNQAKDFICLCLRKE